ncbi:MAG: PLDc_N domain-containing protein [Candidatus Omnitrophica bacterium]|nr:PLDc_N domain-containing protein [Candidatus Omnitrophota bacterium]
MAGLLSLVILVLDIIAIVNVVQGKMSTGSKVLWIILILVLPVIGMVLYFLIGKKNA